MSDDIPVIGRDSLNENEQRCLGGFFSRGPYTLDDPNKFDLVQMEVPAGLQRVANAFEMTIETDRTPAEVVEEREYSDAPIGLPMENDISQQFGSRFVSYSGKVDVVIIAGTQLLVIEIKTREQGIEGIHDIYEGFGQVQMNCDRLREDYPSLCRVYNVEPILLVDESTVDPRLVEPSFTDRGIHLFDPSRGGFLIGTVS